MNIKIAILQNKELLKKIKEAKTSDDLYKIIGKELSKKINKTYNLDNFPLFNVQEERLDVLSTGIGSVGFFGTNFCTHCTNCSIACTWGCA